MSEVLTSLGGRGVGVGWGGGGGGGGSVILCLLRLQALKVSRHLLFVAEFRSCVRKSRWPSWAPVPNKPTVSVAGKATLNQLSLS